MAEMTFSRGRWAGLLAVMGILGLAVASQGCSTTHAIAFAVDVTQTSCPVEHCVCPTPGGITVNPGDKVLLVNASQFEVKVSPGEPGVFDEGDTITIAAKGTQKVTIAKPAPLSSGEGTNLGMAVASPGGVCPGMPGPSIDFD